MRLTDVKEQRNVILVSIKGGKEKIGKLTDMGLIPGERFRVLTNAGSGPLTLLIKESKVAIGRAMAQEISVNEVAPQERKKIRIALVGNPNSGKSTIFNNLTGSSQHVGNYPGVTVEKKEGIAIYQNYEITVVDLPGTYSLSAHSEDEVVARNFIIEEKPDLIVGIVDASNLERNLYLATQLMELTVPLVLAFNMSDVAHSKGQRVDCRQLSQLLGMAIVPTVGNKGKGTQELLARIIDVYEGRVTFPVRQVDYGPEIQEEMATLSSVIAKDPILEDHFPVRWLILKLLEDDPSVKGIIQHSCVADEAVKQAQRSRRHLQAHFGDEAEMVIADRRYGFISGACTVAVTLASVERRHDISDTIDMIVLNRVCGVPLFAAVMYLIFKFTFTLSEPLVGLFEKAFDWLGAVVKVFVPAGLTQSLIVDGLISGVGGVLGFFPLILFMFFAIAFFEDTGYMARAAFVMDRLMSKFGLHGKSFLPLMISTNGCAVPGIMAARTLESKRDRLITIMVTPFMICGAKLPIFALFIAAFFSKEQGPNIMFLMYALSIIVAFVSAYILKRFVLKGEATHFVMELPPYRLPTFKGLLLKMWERGWLYLKKAGTIIFLVSIIVWAAFTFPQTESTKGGAQQLEASYAGRLAQAIEPVLLPIGLDGRSGIALISGLAAKEIVVSTFGTIYSLDGNENTLTLRDALRSDPFWNPLKAVAFLMFCLIYLPCIAATSVFYRESGSSMKWLLFLIFWTTVMAWGAAFVVYQGGLALGIGL